MMISTSRRIIFIATQKSASTSLEHGLRKNFEIRLNETPFGKHMTCIEVQENFSWLLGGDRSSEYFWFCIMRDPVDWVISLYNSHSDDKFNEQQDLSTKGMSIQSFLEKWRLRNPWHSRPQASFFCDETGKIIVDYIIDYNKLKSHLQEISERFELESDDLNQENVSPKSISRQDLSSADIESIHELYGNDLKIYQECTGRILNK